MNRDTEYAERFEAMSDDELVVAFNRQVGNHGWTSARASYLVALHQAFEARGIDYSAIGSLRGFSLRSRARLNGKTLEIVDPA